MANEGLIYNDVSVIKMCVLKCVRNIVFHMYKRNSPELQLYSEHFHLR